MTKLVIYGLFSLFFVSSTQGLFSLETWKVLPPLGEYQVTQTCDVTQMKTALATFYANSGVGASASPGDLSHKIEGLLFSGVAAFKKLCQACQAFTGSLGKEQYTACVNPFNFVENLDADRGAAYGYVAIIKGLVFDCGAAYINNLNNYKCLIDTWKAQNASIVKCGEEFSKEITDDVMGSHFEKMCSAAHTYAVCTGTVFKPCGKEAQWSVCERMRVEESVSFFGCPATEMKCDLS